MISELFFPKICNICGENATGLYEYVYLGLRLPVFFPPLFLARDVMLNNNNNNSGQDKGFVV